MYVQNTITCFSYILIYAIGTMNRLIPYFNRADALWSEKSRYCISRKAVITTGIRFFPALELLI